MRLMKQLGLAIAFGLGLTACGGAAKPAPVANAAARAPEPPAPEPKPLEPTYQLEILADTTASGHGVIKGLVYTVKQQPLIAASVVVTGETLPTRVSALTDETGQFVTDPLPPGHYRVAFYFSDQSHQHQLDVFEGKATVIAVSEWPEQTRTPTATE
jgi:hypothetical protein